MFIIRKNLQASVLSYLFSVDVECCDSNHNRLPNETSQQGSNTKCGSMYPAQIKAQKAFQFSLTDFIIQFDALKNNN